MRGKGGVWTLHPRKSGAKYPRCALLSFLHGQARFSSETILPQGWLESQVLRVRGTYGGPLKT